MKRKKEMSKSALFLFVIVTLMCVPACAGESKPGDGDFLSSTISDVFDKVGQYTSGEKNILYDEEEGDAHDSEEYDRDALGRKIPKATIRSGKASNVNEPL